MQKLYVVSLAVVVMSFGAVQAQEKPAAPRTTPPSQTAPPSKPTPAPQSRPASTLANADRQFILNAAADGHKEIELAEFAEQKATSPAVKALAERLQKDHTQADQELKSLAQSQGVTLPEPPATKTAQGKLEKDKNFDHTYANMMVADHKKAIALFERASKSTNSEVKAFADKTLPTLREHLKMAQDAAGSSTSSMPPATRPTSTSGTQPPGTQAPREK